MDRRKVLKINAFIQVTLLRAGQEPKLSSLARRTLDRLHLQTYGGTYRHPKKNQDGTMRDPAIKTAKSYDNLKSMGLALEWKEGILPGEGFAGEAGRFPLYADRTGLIWHDLKVYEEFGLCEEPQSLQEAKVQCQGLALRRA